MTSLSQNGNGRQNDGVTVAASKVGVQVVYRNIPVEAATPETRMLRNQLHSFSEYDREKIKLRTWTGRREKAERGVYVGSGICPYGYRYVRQAGRTGYQRVVGIEPDPVTAPFVLWQSGQVAVLRVYPTPTGRCRVEWRAALQAAAASRR